MDRRKFMATSATALALPLLSEVSVAADAGSKAGGGGSQLNFLLITADDMDASMPGFMGNRANITPNLDKLAKISHRFVANRSAAPICQPSREALMTGLIPYHSGGIGFTPINIGTPTFTTVLQDNGYFTAGIHKLQHMQPPGCFPWDFQRGGKDGDPLTWDDRNPVLIADHVEEAMAAAREAGKPFFINVNITDPHRPFYGSPAAIKQDNNQVGPYKISREIRPDEVAIPPHLEDLPEIRVELAQYYNSVQRMDIAIGNILERLRRYPEGANTLILFSSDHGMPFPFAKSTCYQNGTHTPVLINWPGMGKPKEFDALTSNIDILPTVLGLLGIDAPEGFDGKSWVPMINGSTEAVRRYNFTYVNTQYDGSDYPMRAIHDERHVMIFSPWSDGTFTMRRTDSMAGLTFNALVSAAKSDPALAKRVDQYTYGVPLAFYDLVEDPGQRINIIDHEKTRVKSNEMKRLLLEHMRATNDPQLKNFELFLSGKKPVVVQNRKRYQHYDWTERPVN